MKHLFKGKTTNDGKWVYGNLVYSETFEDEFTAIIIPLLNNRPYTIEREMRHTSGNDSEYVHETINEKKFDHKDIAFESWYRVEVQSVEPVTLSELATFLVES